MLRRPFLADRPIYIMQIQMDIMDVRDYAWMEYYFDGLVWSAKGDQTP